MHSRIRRVVLGAALAALAAVGALELGRPDATAQDQRPRVLVLGFDGAAAQVTERLLEEGRLPNLSALRERGGYARLATSNPAQSPVSWASMTTGRNPGETGIYDFLRRRFTPGQPGVSIAIGLAEKVEKPVMDATTRAVVVTAAGGLGAILGGLLAFFGLGVLNPAWRRGGRLQAALCAPAAVLALAALAVVSWVPEKVPHARNLRGGEPFWVTLDRAGLVCEALEAPLAFPADPMEHGSCLSGLGVPDVQGTWGTWAIWTDDASVPSTTETAGTGFYVGKDVDAFDLVIPGPLDPRPDADKVLDADRAADEEKYRRELAFDWNAARRRRSETDEQLLRLGRRLQTEVAVTLRRGAGASLRTADGITLDLSPGEWSALIPVRFLVSPLGHVTSRACIHGRVRFLLSFGETPDAATAPGTFRLFVSPVQLDAAAHLQPNLAISSPPEYARELADAVGPFETLGWPELTNPVKDGMLEDVFFLEHLKKVMEGREKRLRARIEAGGWDCLFAMFCEPDRVQHVLWRHTDPQSPTYAPDVSPRFAGEIDRIYEEMDRIVGEAVELAGPETVVLVVSDHGFAPFRRGVNLNNFLRAHGFQIPLAGTAGGAMNVGALAAPGSTFFPDVDWDRTQAYAMGLGNLYLNLKGREPGGIVSEDEADAVLTSIREKLLQLTDRDGTRVVREVYRGSDLYSGSRTADAPDLVVGFEEGYRVSWQTCLGACDEDVIIDNTQRWSADHCSVDPSLVPGILFSSRGLRDDMDPGILDVLPSLLELLDVERDDLEGASFLAR
jgi:predicted AlkP superfamily phosphohydrolase/phosphomutase